MTEDEAKQHWCPFVRFTAENERVFPLTNREERLEAPEGKSSRCIASACMAWRWREAPRTAAFLQAVVEHMKATGDNYSKGIQATIKRREEFTYTEGYCGLAGAPQ